MGASFKTLARVEARVVRALAELEDDDAVKVLDAVKVRVESGARGDDPEEVNKD